MKLSELAKLSKSERDAWIRWLTTESQKPAYQHANAETHAKVMQWLSKASASEVMKVSVKAGVYNPDGSLTEHYRRR